MKEKNMQGKLTKSLTVEKHRLFPASLLCSCRLTILDQLPERECKVCGFGVVSEADVSH